MAVSTAWTNARRRRATALGECGLRGQTLESNRTRQISQTTGRYSAGASEDWSKYRVSRGSGGRFRASAILIGIRVAICQHKLHIETELLWHDYCDPSRSNQQNVNLDIDVKTIEFVDFVVKRFESQLWRDFQSSGSMKFFKELQQW